MGFASLTGLGAACLYWGSEQGRMERQSCKKQKSAWGVFAFSLPVPSAGHPESCFPCFSHKSHLETPVGGPKQTADADWKMSSAALCPGAWKGSGAPREETWQCQSSELWKQTLVGIETLAGLRDYRELGQGSDLWIWGNLSEL